MNKYCESYGLTSVQFLVLMELSEHGHMSISNLAFHLHMSLSNMSAIVKRMEAHNLIMRKRNNCDERIVMIEMQDKASKLLNEMKADMCFQQPLGETLTIKQKEAMIQSLKILNDTIEKECSTYE